MAKAGRPGNDKPRVHVKVEVPDDDGTKVVDLPFVVGVVGDFAGHSAKYDPESDDYIELRDGDRRFVDINEDNFNNVMDGMDVSLKYFVDDKLSKPADGSDSQKLFVDLKFKKMEDFEPTQVINQVPALKSLLEKRNRLRDLLTEVDGSMRLEKLLEKALSDVRPDGSKAD